MPCRRRPRGVRAPGCRSGSGRTGPAWSPGCRRGEVRASWSGWRIRSGPRGTRARPRSSRPTPVVREPHPGRPVRVVRRDLEADDAEPSVDALEAVTAPDRSTVPGIGHRLRRSGSAPIEHAAARWRRRWRRRGGDGGGGSSSPRRGPLGRDRGPSRRPTLRSGSGRGVRLMVASPMRRRRSQRSGWRSSRPWHRRRCCTGSRYGRRGDRTERVGLKVTWSTKPATVGPVRLADPEAGPHAVVDQEPGARLGRNRPSSAADVAAWTRPPGVGLGRGHRAGPVELVSGLGARGERQGARGVEPLTPDAAVATSSGGGQRSPASSWIVPPTRPGTCARARARPWGRRCRSLGRGEWYAAAPGTTASVPASNIWTPEPLEHRLVERDRHFDRGGRQQAGWCRQAIVRWRRVGDHAPCAQDRTSTPAIGATCSPAASAAVTRTRYASPGAQVPSVRRPSQVADCGPAGRAPSAGWPPSCRPSRRRPDGRWWPRPSARRTWSRNRARRRHWG